MMTIKRSLAALVICLAMAIGMFAGLAIAGQPHMVQARNDLNRAYNQLSQAAPDKAGHRVNAMNLVKQAITEVNLGINAGG